MRMGYYYLPLKLRLFVRLCEVLRVLFCLWLLREGVVTLCLLLEEELPTLLDGLLCMVLRELPTLRCCEVRLLR